MKTENRDVAMCFHGFDIMAPCQNKILAMAKKETVETTAYSYPSTKIRQPVKKLHRQVSAIIIVFYPPNIDIATYFIKLIQIYMFFSLNQGLPVSAL